MNWFKDHVYIASWVSMTLSLIAILVAQFRNSKTSGRPFNWFRMIGIVLTLTSFPVILTPAFDTTAREFAKYVFFAAFFSLSFNRDVP